MNADKTEVLIFASDSIASKIAQCIGSLSSAVQSDLRNLCYFWSGTTYQIVDPYMFLSFKKHRQTQACCITARDDHSNFYIILDKLLQFPFRLPQQVFSGMVQNAAARLLTRSSKTTHITSILLSLHWLPIKFRIHFKLLVLTFRALHGQAPWTSLTCSILASPVGHLPGLLTRA